MTYGLRCVMERKKKTDVVETEMSALEQYEISAIKMSWLYQIRLKMKKNQRATEVTE